MMGILFVPQTLSFDNLEGELENKRYPKQWVLLYDCPEKAKVCLLAHNIEVTVFAKQAA